MPLDPQRQYAQLLSVWAQGTKAARRINHRQRGEWSDTWEVWWRLGRRLVERRLEVLPLPTPSPVLLISWLNEHNLLKWATLAAADDQKAFEVYRHVIRIAQPNSPALQVDADGWILTHVLAGSIGRRTWTTLLQWDNPPTLVCDGVSDALTLLGALQAHPAKFRRSSVADWAVLAHLWRHRGAPQKVPLSFDGQTYGWIRCQDDRWVWPRQDEDSVQ